MADYLKLKIQEVQRHHPEIVIHKVNIGQDHTHTCWSVLRPRHRLPSQSRSLRPIPTVTCGLSFHFLTKPIVALMVFGLSATSLVLLV